MSRMHSMATLGGAGFLLVLVQLLGLSLAGPRISAVCGMAIGGLSLPLLAFFQLRALPWWAAPLVAGSSSLAGVVVVGFARDGFPLETWAGPVLAAVVACVIIAIERRRARRCHLCNHHLGAGVAFSCPRCGLLVCEDCWVFELSRCQLCERNHVRILSPDARWWDRQIGPRSEFGRCQLCLKTAQEADLRSCRNCGRSQCTECWDAVNGQCGRCQWTIEDVPESLRVYLIHPPSAREARASHRR